jgi:uncharacterized protein YyaL (SSP411 family)
MTFTNRLIDEASPYLRQHAHNPVDWYPWGREAFEKAESEDKPVFLSIGYSTCHWCHVMERESFDDEQIAEYLNENFVSIKLDREQRPDLDDIYMTGVQMLTGQGGWPMSNFLTPFGKPFFAGTYFPPSNFFTLLQQIVGAWRERRDEVNKQADEVSHNIGLFTGARAEAVAIGEGLARRATKELLGRFDAANGGFGGAPKFPNEPMLMAMLEDWQRNRQEDTRDALLFTLDKMYQGGIYDQVAGGFHRYTVDDVWLVPHFEKMLYNQAQLARVYARAASLFGRADYRRIARETIEYVLRDMRSPAGTFYSATDADSEGEEGLFFVWTIAELTELLGEEDTELISQTYGVTTEGNFEGRNILHLAGPLDEGLVDEITLLRQKLYQAREKRIHPLRDEKVIASWNGMMITTLALVGLDLGEPSYIGAAEWAADTILDRMWDSAAGKLWRIDFEGETSIVANLEDYAYVSESLLTLYAVSGAERWRDAGLAIVGRMREQFADAIDGGFFLSLDEDDGPMITRPKSPMDGAMPSANSVALHALSIAAEATGEQDYRSDINAAISAFGGLLDKSPSAFSYMVCGIERHLAGSYEKARFAGDGNVRVVYEQLDEGCRLRLRMAPGWHINGPVVDDPSLVPSAVEAGSAHVKWPAAEGKVYEGEVEIDISGDVNELSLSIQPCSGELCLAPQTLLFA